MMEAMRTLGKRTEHWRSENHPSSFHFLTLWNSNRRQQSEWAGISQQEASCSYLLLQHSESSESVSRQCESNGHRAEGYRSGLLSECQTIRLWREYKKNLPWWRGDMHREETRKKGEGKSNGVCCLSFYLLHTNPLLNQGEWERGR